MFRPTGNELLTDDLGDLFAAVGHNQSSPPSHEAIRGSGQGPRSFSINGDLKSVSLLYQINMNAKNNYNKDW